MCNTCGCKKAEDEEDVESFDLEEEQAQAIQACNARGYHNFEYTFNPEHFQEWAEEKIANLNDNYNLLGLQYPENEQYQNQNYGNIRRPPRITNSYPIFHGVTCADCGTKLEGLEGAYNNQYIYTIEGAEEEMASVTGVYQDNMRRYNRQNYPHFYDDEGNWNANNAARYRNVAGNMNQQSKLNLIMNMGPSVQCNNCNTYYYPQLDNPESAASQWLRNQYGNGMKISRHTQEEHQANQCSPLTEEECEHCGNFIRWGGNTFVTEEEARAYHGEGICISTVIQCENCNRDYVILKQGSRYGNTVTVNYEGEPRYITVRSPHYNQTITSEKYRNVGELPHISEIEWEGKADNFVAQVKGYEYIHHFELVHNERPPKVAGGEAQPSLCSDGVAQVMSVAKLKDVMRGLGKGSYWKGWNKKDMVIGIGARWNDELKKAKRTKKPATVEIREKPVDKKNVLEYMKSLQENDPDLYDEMMEEMFGAENLSEEFIQVEDSRIGKVFPKRVERFSNTIIFYVGQMAKIRYEHDGSYRRELGTEDDIISIIDPMGITVSDVEKILKKEWDGTYFLFEEGGTFIGGLREYSAEDWQQVECEMCDRQGYSDEMMSIKTVKGDSFLCSRCSRPDINWDKIYPPNKLDMKTYGVSMLGLFVLGILMRRNQRKGGNLE